MSSMEPKKQPKPRTLNQAKVIDAAFAILDEHGMQSLTLKVLAERLDVQAPALYKHFANKEALYIAMAQRLFDSWAEAVLRSESTSPQELMSIYAKECRTMLLSCRNGARIFSEYHQYVSSKFSAHMLSSMSEQGFSEKAAVYSLSTLLSFVIGFSLEEDFEMYAASPAKHLALAAIPEKFLEHTKNADEEFEYGVDCIIAGIETCESSKS